MATRQERFDASLEKLNGITNNIAGDLRRLRDEITAGSVTDESLAKLEANVQTLEAIAATEEEPVPDPIEPEPVEPAEPETPADDTATDEFEEPTR